MNLKEKGKNRISIILIFFIIINIIGDIGNIVFWWVNPDSRAASLNTGIIATSAGVDNALLAGTIILALVAVVYIAGLFGLLKKMSWAPYLIIAISIANRVLALFLYFISPAFAFWTVWTAILVVTSYLYIRKSTTQTSKQNAS